MLFEERRQAQARVAEIDRALREMIKAEPEAVHVAQRDIEREQRVLARLRLTLHVAGNGGFNARIYGQSEQKHHDECDQRDDKKQGEATAPRAGLNVES